MKYLTVILVLLTTTLKGQSLLDFNHRFVECENKWVALRTQSDSVYNFGFIYIDAAAGLTLNYEGTFTITIEGQFLPKKIEKAGVKYRLEPNNVQVAIIPPSKYNELGIQEFPDWLQHYLGDTTSIQHLYRWGFLYNGYHECAKALTYLERAQKIDVDYKGLAVELAFSYNCLQKYDKAIMVLQQAIKSNPTDAYTNKELIYAYTKSGQLEAASEACRNAIAICKDQTYNGENCYNLLYQYYQRKDKVNFNAWVGETKKWVLSNADLIRSIGIMEKDINQ